MYIMLPLFTSYRKSEICFKYLRMLSRMKNASGNTPFENDILHTCRKGSTIKFVIFFKMNMFIPL